MRQPDLPMCKSDYEFEVKQWKEWLSDCKEHVYAHVPLHGCILELDYSEDDGWFACLKFNHGDWSVRKAKHCCGHKLDEAIEAIKELRDVVLMLAERIQNALKETEVAK